MDYDLIFDLLKISFETEVLNKFTFYADKIFITLKNGTTAKITIKKRSNQTI